MRSTSNATLENFCVADLVHNCANPTGCTIQGKMDSRLSQVDECRLESAQDVAGNAAGRRIANGGSRGVNAASRATGKSAGRIKFYISLDITQLVGIGWRPVIL